MPKTWQEKLEDNKGLPKIISYQPNFPCAPALKKMGATTGNSVVIAPASEIYDLMEKVPEGKLLTSTEICKKLAVLHQAQYCCTLTTGIFISTVANASVEMNKDIPWWRTIKNTGELNEKYPGGSIEQKKLLEKEGYTFIQKGRKHI
ncbi:MAG: MGMT family protein [bacterium]